MSTGLPSTPEEGLLVLAMVSVLFFMVVALSNWKNLGIGKDLGQGFVMGGLQLGLISVLLLALMEWEREGGLWIAGAALMVLVMAVISGRRSAKRVPSLPQAFRITSISIAAGSVLALMVLLLTGAMPLRPEFIIPLAGMAFGNSMDICSVSMERIVREFQLNRGSIEAKLALGADSSQAMEEAMVISTRAALIPTIDRMKTLGIILIPGAMAGLVMAGADPLVAAQFQLVIFLMVVGGGIVTSMSALALSRRAFFNEQHQIRDWV
ncbi:MAG: ABC transporter permease [Candidatus Methanomethylophilaceae archaeon]